MAEESLLVRKQSLASQELKLNQLKQELQLHAEITKLDAEEKACNELNSSCVQIGNLKSNTVQNFSWLERSRSTSPCLRPRHHPSPYTTPKPPSYPRPKSSSNLLFAPLLKTISPAQEKEKNSTSPDRLLSHPGRLLSQPDRLPSYLARSDSHTDRLLSQPDRLLSHPDRLLSQPDRLPFHSARTDLHPDRLHSQPDRALSMPDRLLSHPDRLLSQPDRLPCHSARTDLHPHRLLSQPDRLPSYLA